MPPVMYSDGITLVRVGDAVAVTLKIWWIFPSKKNGHVTYVHDPEEKVHLYISDVRVEVSLSENSSLFFSIVSAQLPTMLEKRCSS